MTIDKLNPNEISEKIESLIDKHSANYVLNCIAQIAFEKSDHVQDTWQDSYLANDWAKLGRALDKLADKNEYL